MQNANRFNTGGSMRDGQHEGHPGHRIDQINQNLDRASGSKPNLYLINAGINDCQQNYLNMQGKIGRLNDLLNNAWEKSSRATIILSTLLPSNNEGSNPGANDRVNALNNEIRDCRAPCILLSVQVSVEFADKLVKWP